MKRWFIARMGDWENNGTLGPKLTVYTNVNYRLWSKPGVAFCLGQLASNNIDQFAGDPDIKLIPDAALDNTISTLSAEMLRNMRDQLIAGRFDVSAVKNTWSFRQLLKHMKRQLQTDDNIESGDVPDVES